jgi:hypothetical protein
LSVGFLLLAAGCGPGSGGLPITVHVDLAPEPPVPRDLAVVPPDFAVALDLAPSPCGAPCDGDTPFCDPASRQCVGCVVDANCGAGLICRQKTCAPGCNQGHPECGDAGMCDVPKGTCHGCLGDADCKDPKNRSCDLRTGRCGQCSTLLDHCPDGQYCGVNNSGNTQCMPGCKGDFECRVADGGQPGSNCCNHQCVDTGVAADNCGMCGNACANGSSCCNGACAALAGDILNCGKCGVKCPAMNNVPMCVAGKCMPGPCNMGFAHCTMNPNDVCETGVGGDVNNCGKCGNVCSPPNAMALCLNGVCAVGGCKPGFRDCDGDPKNGCEANIINDPNNCGACNQSCAQLPHAVAACMNGACVVGMCSPGFGNCDKMDNNGCEADLTGDPMNCGVCGKGCVAPPNVMPTCVNSVCGVGQCLAGFVDCDKNPNNGCEVNVNTDPNNCNGCGMACAVPANASAGCAMGVCGIGKCNGGFADCDGNANDGCEININSDANNCGKCGSVCQNGTLCVNGSCTAPGVTYTGQFQQNQTPNQQCNDWNTFRGKLNGNYTSITISGSNDQVGVTCQGGPAGQLCTALLNNQSITVQCSGRQWMTGQCGGGIELSAAGNICGCNSPAYLVRPCIGNQNWGGVNSATCGGPTQTITVTCK